MNSDNKVTMYSTDKRVVITLDAGGTNFVFGAMRGCEFIVEPITHPSNSENLDKCLDTLVKGFSEVIEQLSEKPVAISFAFPGPADYPNGIIGGYLPNFPSFRDGVALGPYLAKIFGIPVFINNDGNLFAYGEAFKGVLADVNARLKAAGSSNVYKNLLGITLGTGFGAGIVINGQLLLGDNSAGGEIWCLRNRKYPTSVAEESVSIRAVKRVYAELSACKDELSPKDIYDIAEGIKEGNQEAAKSSFAELGKCAGDAIAMVVTIIDGIIVLGGGVLGASKYIVPALIEELNSKLERLDGEVVNRLQMEVVNLDDPLGFEQFIQEGKSIKIPNSTECVMYNHSKRIGVAVSKLGASRSVSIGAYIYALNNFIE